MAILSVFEFWPLLLRGISVTLLLSVVAIAGGTILGLVIGVGLTSRNVVIRFILNGYSGIFRGSPLLVQLFMIYLGLAYLGFNVPVFAAAAIGFILHASAYVAEIVRGGIEAVPRGQFEASESLGLTRTQLMRRVVLPQTLRMVLPALASYNVSLIKDTSIASIVGFVDLMKEGQAVVALTGKPFETYFVIAVIYFAICFPLSRCVGYLEKRSIYSDRGPGAVKGVSRKLRTRPRLVEPR
jgi:polar amino acid transport system permease protein